MAEPALLAKYTPAPAAAGRPVAVLGVEGVVAVEGDVLVPVHLSHVSAQGKWVRDLFVPDGTAQAVAALAARYSVVWASEWGPNAHPALAAVLGLPAEPWPYLPIQFNKLAAIRAYAGDRPWVWIDDPVVDLGPRPDDPGGFIVRVDPARGLVGVDLGAVAEALGHLAQGSSATHTSS